MRAPCPECGCFYLDLTGCPRCQEPSTPVPPASVPAGFWRRGGALVVDYGVVLGARAVMVAATRVIFGSGAESSQVLGVSMWAFPALFGFAYTVLAHWIWGQTLGKMALAVRVVMQHGGPLTLGVAVGRQSSFVLSVLALGLGLALAAVRADRRALHDLLAGTRVELAR